MNNRVFVLLFILTVVVLSSCSYFKRSGNSGTVAVARVNDEYLYAYDISFVTKGMTSEDSLKALREYAETWVKKKLLLQKAKENIASDDVGIVKKVEDYREALLLYEYEKALLNQKLDTVVGTQEVSDWYEKMKQNFLLESDVYHLYFIKIKDNAPNLAEFKKLLLKPKDDEDMRKVEGYCREYATSYSLDEGMWYTQDNLLKNFPLSNYELSQLISTKKFSEIKREEGFWYLRIDDMKKQGEPSPVEFIQSDIEKIIIEKRKMKFIDKTYDRILGDGAKEKAYEIYLK